MTGDCSARDRKAGSARRALVMPWRCPLWPLSFYLPFPGARGPSRQEQGQGKVAEPEARAETGLTGDRAKALSCICSWSGAAFGWTLVHAKEERNALTWGQGCWRAVLWSLDSLAQTTTIYLLSSHLFIKQRGGLSTCKTVKSRNL